MSLLPSRTSLFDDLFHDMASGFYIRPLHGDPLPSQIKLDLRESDGGYLLQAELPLVENRALPGYLRFYVKDPAGNQLEFLEPDHTQEAAP